MTRRTLRDLIARGDLDRRAVARMAAAAGVGLAFVPLGARAQAGADALYYVLGGFAEDGLFGPYKAKHGAAPSTSFWGDEEEAFAKLRAGFEPDVTYCGTYSVPRWRDADLLQPIDTGRLRHWNDLIATLRDVPGTTVDGVPWCVPVGWGTTSIVYRTDIVGEVEQSWGLLWDERFAGKLAMIDGVADAVAGAAIHAGIDPYTMDDAAIEAVKATLVRQRPLLRLYTSDMTSLAQAIASGEVVAAMAWNDAYAALRREGVPVAYMFQPKERCDCGGASVRRGSAAPRSAGSARARTRRTRRGGTARGARHRS